MHEQKERTHYVADLFDEQWEVINSHFPASQTNRGRKSEPGAGILDSQSFKTTEMPDVRGYDAAMKVKGRKRHILLDTIELLLVVVVRAANIQDRDRTKNFFEKVKGKFFRLELIWADAGYSG